MMKTIITMSILFSVNSISSEYFAIVKKEKQYEVIENPLWVNIDPTYSEWNNTGVISNCSSWSPEILQQKNDFSQERICDLEQSRTKYLLQQNTIDNSIKTEKEEIEFQFVSSNIDRDIVVSSLEPVIENSYYNCNSWTPEAETFYSGTPLNQTRACDVDMMTEWVYTSNSEEITTWEEVYTENNQTETQNTVGTLLLTNCLDILNQGYSVGDNIYSISPEGDASFDVYCDMNTDGGGWTLFQGGTVNNDTTDHEFGNYYTSYINYIDEEIFYGLPYENRNRVEFSEFKTLHQGETALYRNHVVLGNSAKTSTPHTDLINIPILSYTTSFSMNGHDNYVNQTNCEFGSAYKGHVNCLEGVESQNPWYQNSKIRAHVNNEFGVHTCMRFIVENGDN